MSVFITADSFAGEGENDKINELIKLPSPAQHPPPRAFVCLASSGSFWVPRSIAHQLSPLFYGKGMSGTGITHVSAQEPSGSLQLSAIPATAQKEVTIPKSLSVPEDSNACTSPRPANSRYQSCCACICHQETSACVCRAGQNHHHQDLTGCSVHRRTSGEVSKLPFANSQQAFKVTW